MLKWLGFPREVVALVAKTLFHFFPSIKIYMFTKVIDKCNRYSTVSCKKFLTSKLHGREITLLV